MQWYQRVTDTSINCLRAIVVAESPWKIRLLHAIPSMLSSVHRPRLDVRSWHRSTAPVLPSHTTDASDSRSHLQGRSPKGLLSETVGAIGFVPNQHRSLHPGNSRTGFFGSGVIFRTLRFAPKRPEKRPFISCCFPTMRSVHSCEATIDAMTC